MELDLNIEVDVLTAGCVAEVVIAIFESLLYQRNQIPFVYKTYRYYINKWEDEENLEKHETVSFNFQAQRQKNHAKVTKNSISAMRQAINDAFDGNAIKCLRFLFGATAFTPKEAYTVRIPTENILRNHCHKHHRISPEKLNQTLLSLLTNERLYAIFSNNLNPSNVYMELEVIENPDKPTSFVKFSKSQIFAKDYAILPPSCKDIHINLRYKRNADFDDKQLKCCEELQIFQDIISLNLESETNIRDDDNKDKPIIMLMDGLITGWWESEIVVRGFKEKPIKGFNLWS